MVEDKEETQNYELTTDMEIREVLRKLPSLICAKQKYILNANIQKDEMIKKTKTIESDVQRAIASETEEVEDKKTGLKVLKDKYKNEMQREAQKVVRLINNIEYNKMRDVADKLDKGVKIEDIILSYLKRVHNSAIALTNLGTKI